MRTYHDVIFVIQVLYPYESRPKPTLGGRRDRRNWSTITAHACAPLDDRWAAHPNRVRDAFGKSWSDALAFTDRNIAVSCAMSLKGLYQTDQYGMHRREAPLRPVRFRVIEITQSQEIMVYWVQKPKRGIPDIKGPSTSEPYEKPLRCWYDQLFGDTDKAGLRKWRAKYGVRVGKAKVLA